MMAREGYLGEMKLILMEEKGIKRQPPYSESLLLLLDPHERLNDQVHM
jgi:hypothetical protein